MCPPVFDRDVLALDVTGLTQAAVKGREKLAGHFERCKVEKPDHRHFLLLRPRHEWEGSCTTEKGDELPPLHSALIAAEDKSRDYQFSAHTASACCIAMGPYDARATVPKRSAGAEQCTHSVFVPDRVLDRTAAYMRC